MRGFTVIEILIVISIVAIVVVLTAMPFVRGCDPDLEFSLLEPKDIKIIVNPVTGETSECIRPFNFGEWKCRSMNIQMRPAEKE